MTSDASSTPPQPRNASSAADSDEGIRTTWLVDAHVHFHECFPCQEFLEGTEANFATAARTLGASKEWTGVLLLAGIRGRDELEALRTSVTQCQLGGWTCQTTEEDGSVALAGPSGRTLVAIRGRQINSAESIELLALGSNNDFPDGMPLKETYSLVSQSDALTVLPWGFGKWWFRRGVIVRELLGAESAGTTRVFLGDNRMRPNAFGHPRLFQMARNQGLSILPGSDPFPIARDVRNVGRCGVVLEGPLDLRRPGDTLKSMLRNGERQPKTFGQNDRVLRFVRDQIEWRLRRHWN